MSLHQMNLYQGSLNFPFNFKLNDMVVLKSESQINNFIKRMKKKYNFNRQEGCGCCYSYAFVNRDEETNKIILESCYSYAGNETYKITVIAVTKH